LEIIILIKCQRVESHHNRQSLEFEIRKEIFNNDMKKIHLNFMSLDDTSDYFVKSKIVKLMALAKRYLNPK